MRISTKGQITIPLEIRNSLGLLPHTEVFMRARGNQVILEKKTGTSSRGKYVVDRMRGKASVKMSTEEICSTARTVRVGCAPQF